MIQCICGLQNDGKTLYMSYLAQKEYNLGKNIISNFDLNIPHIQVNKDFIIWVALHQPNFFNTSFFLDEIWLWFDSRSMGIGKGLDSTIGTYFFLQSSKNSANIYLSQQLLSQTEIRIRNNLHRYSECRRFLKVDNKWKRIISDKRDLGEELNPFVYIQIKTYDRNLNISGSTLSKPKIIYLPAQQFFKLYNTYEKKVIV